MGVKNFSYPHHSYDSLLIVFNVPRDCSQNVTYLDFETYISNYFSLS